MRNSVSQRVALLGELEQRSIASGWVDFRQAYADKHPYDQAPGEKEAPYVSMRALRVGILSNVEPKEDISDQVATTHCRQILDPRLFFKNLVPELQSYFLSALGFHAGQKVNPQLILTLKLDEEQIARQETAPRVSGRFAIRKLVCHAHITKRELQALPDRERIQIQASTHAAVYLLNIATSFTVRNFLHSVVILEKLMSHPIADVSKTVGLSQGDFAASFFSTTAPLLNTPEVAAEIIKDISTKLKVPSRELLQNITLVKESDGLLLRRSKLLIADGTANNFNRNSEQGTAIRDAAVNALHVALKDNHSAKATAYACIAAIVLDPARAAQELLRAGIDQIDAPALDWSTQKTLRKVINNIQKGFTGGGHALGNSLSHAEREVVLDIAQSLTWKAPFLPKALSQPVGAFIVKLANFPALIRSPNTKAAQAAAHS